MTGSGPIALPKAPGGTLLVTAHRELFHNLIRGDGDSADKHREFYDEFLAVMDLTAEYYLQTIETVFQKHSLPKG